MELDLHALGRRVRQEREKRGWTQARLAEEAGISDSHISAIERGGTDFSVTNLVKLANAYGIPSDALLYGAIYSHAISLKMIDDAVRGCEPWETKLIADCITGLRSSLRAHCPGAHG